jgi:phage shock protein PspC (stress-responsive transcriptional regulator)
MRKTVNINISGTVFYIDEDAYTRLKEYLGKLERYFRNQEEGEEIYKDIESRIAELFSEKVQDKTGVINIDLVEAVINKMGEPEDFEEESTDEPRASKVSDAYYYKSRKRLYRDVDNRVLGGVCGGIAAYLNTDPVLIRILFAILPFLSFGIIVPVYIILWIVVPAAITTAQKLEMRGENVTIKNIEKAMRNEYEDVKKQFSRVRESDAYKKGESWWKKLTKRDRNVLTVVAIICGVVLLANLFHFNVFDGGFVNNINFHPGHIPHVFHFPGIMVLVLVLLVVGFLFKSIFKIVIYLIAFVLIAVLGLKLIGFVMGSVFMLC